jgi:hypothetical protein
MSRRGAFFDLERTWTPHAVEQEVALAFWRAGSPTAGGFAPVARAPLGARPLHGGPMRARVRLGNAPPAGP